MSEILAKFRQKYPGYADVPDAALADALHRKFYADVPREQFNQRIGLSAEPRNSMPNRMSSEGDLRTAPAPEPLTQAEKYARDYGPHMKEYGQKLKDLPQNLNSLARKAASGVSFGLADEFAAGMRSLTEGGSYSDKLAEERAEDKRISEEMPVLSTIAEVAGSALPIIATGGALAPAAGAGTAARIGTYGLTGAGTGALSGFGNAEGGAAERGLGALKGAAIGGAAGAALSAVGIGARKLATMAMRPFAGASNPTPVAAQQIIEAMRRDGMTTEQIAQRLKDLGDDATLLDAGGRNMLGLGRAVTQAPGATKELAENVLSGRQADMAKRVIGALDDAVPGVGGYDARFEALKQARAKMAGPLYEEAFKANKAIDSPLLKRIEETPAGKAAFAKARNMMLNDMERLGVPDAELTAVAREAGAAVPKGGVASGLKLELWDYVKRALDDDIGKAVRDGSANEVRVLTGLKKSLVNELDRLDATAAAGPNSLRADGGAYARARAAFAGPSQVRDAMDAGLNAKLFDPSALRETLKGVKPADLDAFREGVAEQIRRKVLEPGEGINVARQIFASPARREVLKEVMGEAYPAFEKAMRAEMQKFATQATIRGGSVTAPRLEEGADLASGIGAARDAASGNVLGLAGRLYSGLAARSRGPEAVRDAIGRSLLAQGADAQAAVSALDRAVAAGTIDPARAALVQAMIGAGGGQVGALSARR